MPLISAIGTSLVAVSAFGAATAASFAASGFIDFALAALFVLGGIAAGLGGVFACESVGVAEANLKSHIRDLVIVVGLYVVSRGVLALMASG